MAEQEIVVLIGPGLNPLAMREPKAGLGSRGRCPAVRRIAPPLVVAA